MHEAKEHADKEDDSFCDDADDKYDINDDFLDDSATTYLMDDEELIQRLFRINYCFHVKEKNSL